MTYDIAKVDRIAALFGMFWFVFIIDACFTWFFPWKVRYFLGAPFALYATTLLAQNHGIVVSKLRRGLFMSLLVLTIYMVFTKYEFFVAPLRFLPMMCLVFWRESALAKMYEYLKKFIVFYAILSILVEILVITNTWTSFPYMILPPQDNVQEQLDYVNYYFGIYSIQATDTSIDFYRACGPLREGGHFALFVGFIYFAEKVIYNKRNIWLIICGILTLSPNFIIAFIVTEGCVSIHQRKYFKPFFITVSVIFLMVVGFIIAPERIQDEVIRVVLERSLENNYNNVENEGVMALIDGRAGMYGLSDYDAFLRKGTFTRLFGMGELPEDNVMSDTRYLIMLYGYIGTLLIFYCLVVFSIKKEFNAFGLSIFALGLLIFVHRSWMFQQVYWWTVMLQIRVVKSIVDKNQSKWSSH